MRCTCTPEPTGPEQRNRAFEKKLIPIRVSVGLCLVHARIATETDKCRRLFPRSRTALLVAMIRAHHVPGWIAEHRVEPAVQTPSAIGVEEDLWKFQFPMKEAMLSSHCCAFPEKRVRLRLWQCASIRQHVVRFRGQQSL